jgi:protein TonB
LVPAKFAISKTEPKKPSYYSSREAQLPKIERKEARMTTINQYRGRWSNALRVLAFSMMAVSVFGQESRKIIANPAPVYPQLAKRDHLSGTVKVLVTIAPDGHIKDAKVVGGSPVFVNAALDALNNWRYVPSNSETTAVVEFNFHP